MKANRKKKSANNNWEHLAGSDWARLLEFQPRFADKCDFSQLSASDWSEVLAVRPDLVDKFESVERDWDKDGGLDDVPDFDAIYEAASKISRED